MLTRFRFLIVLTLVSVVWISTAATDTVTVPMRDGTKLATDFHVPPHGGPAFPVVLVRTLYGRKNIGFVDGLNAAGFAH